MNDIFYSIYGVSGIVYTLCLAGYFWYRYFVGQRRELEAVTAASERAIDRTIDALDNARARERDLVAERDNAVRQASRRAAMVGQANERAQRAIERLEAILEASDDTSDMSYQQARVMEVQRQIDRIREIDELNDRHPNIDRQYYLGQLRRASPGPWDEPVDVGSAEELGARVRLPDDVDWRLSEHEWGAAVQRLLADGEADELIEPSLVSTPASVVPVHYDTREGYPLFNGEYTEVPEPEPAPSVPIRESSKRSIEF